MWVFLLLMSCELGLEPFCCPPREGRPPKPEEAPSHRVYKSLWDTGHSHDNIDYIFSDNLVIS